MKQLSTRRERDYDYSQPGVHHVLLETKDDAEIPGKTVWVVTTLSDASRAVPDIVLITSKTDLVSLCVTKGIMLFRSSGTTEPRQSINQQFCRGGSFS